MAIKDIISKIISKKGDLPNHFINSGSTGTEIYSGYFDEEYLPEFNSMPEGIDTYDEMRRSDDQVNMLLNLTKIPLKSANWGVEAVDDSEEEQDIAEFVNYVLMNDISYPDGSKYKTFKQFVSESLTFLDFGYALFEPVYKIVTDHPKYGSYVGLKDIAYRSPKTIYEWNLNPDGSINNVRQTVDGDLAVDVNIPGENLLVITHNKEGDNYEGISALRPIYGNWLRKNNYRKIEAMGLERTATGSPVGTIPQGQQDNKEQFNKFKEMLKRYTSNQQTYMLKPAGYEIDNIKIPFDAKAVQEGIQSENQGMAKSFLAGFMELGLGGQAGSQSLGADLSTIFLNGIKSYAQQISDAVDYNIIKKLVDAKYGKRTDYPKLKANDIVSKNSKEIAEMLVMLSNAGLLTITDKLQDYVNREFDLPEVTQDEREQLKQDKIDSELNTQNKTKDPEQFTEKKSANPSRFITQQAKIMTEVMRSMMSERIESNVRTLRKKLKGAKNIKEKRVILKENKLPSKQVYLRTIKGMLAKDTDIARQQVVSEIPKVNRDKLKFDETSDLLKLLPAGLRSKLITTIDKAIGKQDSEVEDRMFFIASEKLETTESVETLITDIENTATDYIASGVTNVIATNLVSNMVNSARNDVFQTPQVFEEIESFIIVNPSPEAAICKELTGRVFSKQEYIDQDLPPYHHNCETTVRAQYKGQKKIRPINPIGLSITGTQQEIEKILKSKTF